MADKRVWALKKEYDDFDQFTSEVQAWSLDFKQLDRGGFRGETTHVVASEFQLGRARFYRRLHQSGQPPQGFKTFVVPMEPDMRLFWRGMHLEGNDLMAFPLNGELDAVSEVDFDVLTISLPLSVVSDMARKADVTQAKWDLLESEVRRCDPKAMQHLRRRLIEVKDSVEREHVQERSLSSLAMELAGLIAEVWLGAQNNGWKKTASSRAKIVRCALEHIEHSSDEPLTVADLCRFTDVSERTLEYAFLERFGVCPKRYLLTHRLNCVRRALRKSDASTTKVVDVANHWGFWHMGQFAADYRRVFSELPSETLRATSGFSWFGWRAGDVQAVAGEPSMQGASRW